jgi:hypothetical protein
MPASFFVSERFLFLGTGIHLKKPIHDNPLLRSGVEYRQKLRSLCLSPVGYHCNQFVNRCHLLSLKAASGKSVVRLITIQPVNHHCNLSLITVIDSTEGGNGERGICPRNPKSMISLIL